ncbi:hypothetical protein [Candidatus Poriferisocius sp.]|uniref:hypothetical protein n=1 Tax=Candidatus Poriferisocius sp. TaxID=3101276 RepID=UPI003B01C99B
MTFSSYAPASSVFEIKKVRLPGFRNALRVFWSLVLGLLAQGDTGWHPSSHKFQVLMIESGEVLSERSWAEGAALLQDLESLTAREFAELWVPTSVPAVDAG